MDALITRTGGEDLRHLFSEELPNRDNFTIVALMGGEGSRAQFATGQDINKGLLPITIGDQRISMYGALFRLLPANFSNVVTVTSRDPHAHSLLTDAFNKEQMQFTKGLNVSLLEEPVQKGTAGAVNFAIENSKIGDFMIITPTDIKFPFYVLEDVARKFVEDQKEGVKMLWVLTSVPGENTQNVGKVKVENGRVIATNEHIKDSCPFGEGMTSVGVLVIKKNDYTKIYNAYVDQLPKRPEKVDLYREIIPYMLEKEMKISVFDIKRPAEDLGESHRYLKDSLKSLLDLKSKGMFLNN